MRFLADESCDFSVVRALRDAGHDVATVIESHRGADDEMVMRLASSESRVLLTEDKDFGQLAFAAARRATGVVFIRWPASIRESLPAAVLDAVSAADADLVGAFLVLEPGRVRIARLP